VIASMRKCRSRRQVLILDCCYAGAFSKAMLAKGQESIGIQERFATEGAGRVVLAASDSMQVALEGKEIRGEPSLSAFTRILVDGIQGGEADQDGDGHISLDELYDYLYERMRRDNPDQTPTISNLEKQGDIVIALSPRAAAPPPIVDDEPESAVVADVPVPPGPPPDDKPVGGEPTPGLLAQLVEYARIHRRLTIGVGAALVVAAIVAVVLLVAGGGSSARWALAEVGSDVLGPGQRIKGIAALPGGDSAIAVGVSRSRPAVWIYDGSSWSSVPRADVDGNSGQMLAAAASGPTAVAVGNVVESQGNVGAMVWRRSGARWVRDCPTECGGAGRQEMLAVARIAGGLIAVGRDSSSGRFDGAVWRLRDGETSWHRIARNDLSLDGAFNQSMRGVVQIGGRIVAVGSTGSDGAIWTSRNDGDSWTQVPSSAVLGTPGHAIELLAVTALSTAAGPRLIAVGRETVTGENQAVEAAAWYSDDGERWSRATVRNARFSVQQMVDVDASAQGVVAVGNATGDRAGVWESTDGTDWSGVNSRSFGRGSGMAGIAELRNGTSFAVGSAIWVKQSG
jgi:hypothetical protein